MIWIINSDVQIFQTYGHTTRIPDFRVIGPSEIRLKSDMSDSPDFYSSEIRGDRFTDFSVHTARLSGNRLQKVGRLEKIGQWDHGIIHDTGALIYLPSREVTRLLDKSQPNI